MLFPCKIFDDDLVVPCHMEEDGFTASYFYVFEPTEANGGKDFRPRYQVPIPRSALDADTINSLYKAIGEKAEDMEFFTASRRFAPWVRITNSEGSAIGVDSAAAGALMDLRSALAALGASPNALFREVKAYAVARPVTYETQYSTGAKFYLSLGGVLIDRCSLLNAHKRFRGEAA